MSEYRRLKDPGTTVFLTIVTYNRAQFLLDRLALDCLISAHRHTRSRLNYLMEAYCILPDHFHVMLTLPRNESDYSLRMRTFKTEFTRIYLARGGLEQPVSRSGKARRERGIWQRRFWEHTIRDINDYKQHLDYIHHNAVKHGLVDKAGKWSWSSFQRYVRKGFYDPDWGERPPDTGTNRFGE